VQVLALAEVRSAQVRIVVLGADALRGGAVWGAG
jgi:hypothetical protein